MCCYTSKLAVTPTIESLPQLDQVLRELSAIKHYRTELEAQAAREMEQVISAYQPRMVCRVGRGVVSLADRQKQLESIASEWCRAHLREHFGTERSVSLAHGRAGFRKQTPKITFAKGVDEAEFVRRVDAKTGIVASVTALLTKALSYFTIGQVVRFRPEINRQDAKALWDANPEARATLEELGITVSAGDDQVTLEPCVYRVEQPPQ